ncbi:MAG TPA: O-antigen ligase family protein [Candidatus Polarisedimenticolia bacterium]|jgi:O-antigen ligase|nr:O-antigen ligase family protein [Candidatus Polarisedimenticolia bacterium]
MSSLKSLSLADSLSYPSKVQILGLAAVGTLVAGFLYLGFPVTNLPWLIVGGILALLTLRSPVIGLTFVLASQYAPFAVGGLTVVQIAGPLVALIALLWYAANKRGIVLGNTTLPMIFLIFHLLYSLNFTKNAALTWSSLRKLSFNIIFCVLIVNVVNSYRKLRLPLWILTGMGALNSLAAFYQVAVGKTIDNRARGLLENENQFGEVAAMTFFVPFYFFLNGTRRWEKALGFGLSVLLMGGMILSISRGAIIAFVGGICMVVIRERRSWRRILFFAVLGACAYPLLPQHFSHRFEKIGSELRGTVVLSQRHGLSVRGYYNKAGLKIWKANPVLGVGLGNYGYYYIQPEFNPGMPGVHTLPPHNLYVQALAETGTLGFLLLCWWILQAGYNYMKAEQRAPPPEDLTYLRAAETLTLLMLIAAFASGNLLFTHTGVVLSLSYVCLRASENDPAATPAPTSSSS